MQIVPPPSNLLEFDFNWRQWLHEVYKKLSQSTHIAEATSITSGTSHEIRGIPQWATKIEVMFYTVGSNGAAYYSLYLFDSARVTTYYQSTRTKSNNGGSTDALGEDTGSFRLNDNTVHDSGLFTGKVTLTKMGTSNQWIAEGSFRDGNGHIYLMVGKGWSANTITGFDITTSATAFDAGSISYRYE